MNVNALPSEKVAVLGAIDPDAYTAASPNSSYSTSWVEAAQFHQLLAIVMVGTLGTGAEIDAKLEQATSSGGAGAKDVTGKAITQISESDSPTPNDKQMLINLRGAELDVENDFTHVRLTITVGDATSDFGGLLLGLDPRFGPADDFDASSVSEIVT